MAMRPMLLVGTAAAALLAEAGARVTFVERDVADRAQNSVWGTGGVLTGAADPRSV